MEVAMRSAEENEDRELVQAVDEAIAEHGGDARAAIRSLLETVSYLEKARDRALDLVSRGYARGTLTAFREDKTRQRAEEKSLRRR